MRASLFIAALVVCLAEFSHAQQEPLFEKTLSLKIPHVSSDPEVKLDYDIVYVRADRAGDDLHKRFYTDFSQPVTMQPGADLMLLHPDGSEELLVDGGQGSVTDPFVSFDGNWVYYTHIYDLKNANQWNPPRAGADIFKINLESRKIVRLTNQKFEPNLGAANWSSDFRNSEQGKTHFDYGVFNMGPCPLPGGRIAFTSNRHGFRPAKGYPTIALQLFVMDDRDESIGENEDPVNLEKIGHFNISGALHPVILKDGRIMFSTLESQGIRSEILWGIWTIHPDGTNWAPLISAFDPGGAPNGFHFQTQLTDGSLIAEEYYNQNNSGFGAYIKLPPSAPANESQFGPAYMNDERNKPWRYSRHYNAKGRWYRKPFMPTGSVSLTPFTHGLEGPAGPSVFDDKDSPHVGKFTHPSGAPNNHLLTVYSPGPVNHQYTYLPQLDGGIYLLKDGKIIEEPAELRLIKNDPKYNECWPRAVVTYQEIYGVPEPRNLAPLANDGGISKDLPPGTPFGLVGTSSFYKRESYPNGVVPAGKVTAECPEEIAGRDPWKGLDAFTSHGNGVPLNWHNQGGDAGLYSNSEIHAVRILAMEPTTDQQRGTDAGHHFFNHANERLRILGEIPLRKFNKGQQPLDPDGQPDTSFLAKIPADTAFTFQTIDKDGLLLNMSQTWHQLRPGEKRVNCGGCHAHSQEPTLFEDTAAARADYKLWDLTKSTPLIASKKLAPTETQWDTENETGVKYETAEVVNVEYWRHIRPILNQHCTACHTSENGKQPAGNLDLAQDGEIINLEQGRKLPGTYYRLAGDERAQFGHKPLGYDTWGYPNASRYIRKFQARRSLLVWKLFGRRLDGFHNDDHPSESKPGARDFVQKGETVDAEGFRARWDIDFQGMQMPPPEAVAAGKIPALSEEDRRTILRWIDLGCPIDLDYDPEQPERRGRGWMLDDNRPIAAVTLPVRGENESFSKIIFCLHDYDTGLEMPSLSVTTDFPIGDAPAGENLASRFKETSPGVWEYSLPKPIKNLPQAVLTLSVADQQGNVSKVSRTFSVK